MFLRGGGGSLSRAVSVQGEVSVHEGFCPRIRKAGGTHSTRTLSCVNYVFTSHQCE